MTVGASGSVNLDVQTYSSRMYAYGCSLGYTYPIIQVFQNGKQVGSTNYSGFDISLTKGTYQVKVTMTWGTGAAKDYTLRAYAAKTAAISFKKTA